MRTCEWRHLDEVKRNFGFGDALYYRDSAKTMEIPLHNCSYLVH